MHLPGGSVKKSTKSDTTDSGVSRVASIAYLVLGVAIASLDYFEALVAASLSRSRAPFRMSVSA